MTKADVTRDIDKPILVYKLPSEFRKAETPEMKTKLLTLRIKVWRLVQRFETIPLDNSVYLILNPKDVDIITPQLQKIKAEYTKIGFARAVLFIGNTQMSNASFQDNFLFHFEQKIGSMIEQLQKKGSVTEKTLELYIDTVATVEKVIVDFGINDKAISHLIVVAKDNIKKRTEQIEKISGSEWV